jgi:hypothetical protein
MPSHRLRLAGSSPIKRASLTPASKSYKSIRFVEGQTAATRNIAVSKELGLPARDQWDGVVAEYIKSLSTRKREKALISQAMFDDIWDVLQDPMNPKIRTPQFRFWVRKMFKLSHADPAVSKFFKADNDSDVVPVILHEGLPVAVKEQTYDIISYYHLLSGHGGRDKTMAEVRLNYSWVPKELVARYIKACPTCVYKRTGEMAKASTLGSLIPQTFNWDATGIRSLPSEDYDTDAISSSYSQAVSLASSEEGFVVNPALMPVSCAVAAPIRPLHTLASLVDSRILPTPVLSPILRSPPMGSPNLSADPRKWLQDLTMQPGPNHTPIGYTHKIPPLILRRTGSQNDADPIRGPASRVTLPPLMKALSEGMADIDIARPAFNVPQGLNIPGFALHGAAYSEDVVMTDATTGSSYSPGSILPEEYTNIDPVLLGLGYGVVNTYDSYAQQQKLFNDTGPLDIAVMFQPEHSSEPPVFERSAGQDSVTSSLSGVDSVRSSDSTCPDGPRRLSNASGKGIQPSSSFDPQDWESSYCLDEV